MTDPLLTVIRDRWQGAAGDPAPLAAELGDLLGETVTTTDIRQAGTPEELAALVRARRADRVDPHPTPAGELTWPATAGQAGIWYVSESGAARTAYNSPVYLSFAARLDPAVLREALAWVVSRHESLRTTFGTAGDGTLMQRVAAEGGFDFTSTTVASVVDVEKLSTEFAIEHLDLSTGPLLRVLLLDRGAEGTTLLVNVHHAVFDGFSWSVLLTEWLTTYRQLTAGAGLPDLPAPTQFREAVAASGNGAEAADLAYWVEHLADAPPVLDLPLDHPAGRRGEVPAGSVRTVLSGAEAARLRERAVELGVTPSVVVLAAYGLLLHRHTGQRDLTVGLPVSLRDRRVDQEVIGHLVNTVVLRYRISPGDTGGELLTRTRDEVLAAMRHKHAALERVVEAVAPGRDSGRSPVFQTMVTLMPEQQRNLRHLGMGVDEWRHVSGTPKYDLVLVVEEGVEEFALTFEYDPAVLDSRTVERIAARYRSLLADLLAHPERDVRELRWIPDRELRELAEVWNGPVDHRPAQQSVPTLFEDRVRRHPDRVALESPAGDLTYAQLNAAANRLARALRGCGAGAGTRVALCLERGPDAVTGLLAVLKVGASYVPLDPAYPRDRLELMLQDAQPRIVVVRGGTDCDVPAGSAVFDLDRWDGSGDETDLPVQRAPDDEMYVVYTSGSTGRPKGVVIEDYTITNLVYRQQDLSGPVADARTLQFMPISFDVSFEEIFSTLCSSGTLVVPDEQVRTDLRRLADHLRDKRVARVFLPYVALQELADVVTRNGLDLPDLAEVYTTGEALVVTPQLREMFRRFTRAALLNVYGPSEAHLVTGYRLPADPAAWPERPPIGHVVGNVRTRVLDEDGRPVPFGVTGELYVCGRVVGRGYLHRPEQTRERFAPDPTGSGPDSRRYRTGDLVVCTPSDGLRHLGRADDQIKIRGYRIEPGEVEAALNDLPGVTASAVVAADHGPGDRRLVAFLRTDEEVDEAALRSRLSGSLPGYLVPARFVRLDRFPVAPSGKTDRKALAAQAVDLSPPQPQATSSRPFTTSERRVAEVWRRLFDGAPVAPEADFYEFGGHSLLAVRLRQALQEEFEIEVPLSALLSVPTVAGMAACAEQARGGEVTTAGPDLWADTRLLDGLTTVASGPIPEPAAARTVLLTGVTGFLGIFLLQALQAAGCTVYCLVRARDAAAGRERIAESVRQYRATVDVGAVEVVAGDLSQERFGLSAHDYQNLAGRIQAVYHAAAHINFAAPYVSVRPTNVEGFVHTVKFCADTILKPLHYMSTLAVFSPAEPPREIDEDSVPATAEGLGISYPQSKWVAEQLAVAARQRGIPVTVYRIGRIGPESRTGACRADDFFWLQIKSFLQLGAAPAELGRPVDLLPVDLVADAVVRLARSHAARNRNVHIFHPVGLAWDTIMAALDSLGRRPRTVSTEEWLSSLEAHAGGTDDRSLASLVPLFREGVMELADHRYVNHRTIGDLQDLGLELPAPDPAWVISMIRYFADTDRTTSMLVP